MPKRPANPSWGISDPFGTRFSKCDFECVTKNLGLSPEQYVSSDDLKDWVRRNKDSKYVPLDLLMAWGFTPKSKLTRFAIYHRW